MSAAPNVPNRNGPPWPKRARALCPQCQDAIDVRDHTAGDNGAGAPVRPQIERQCAAQGHEPAMHFGPPATAPKLPLRGRAARTGRAPNLGRSGAAIAQPVAQVFQDRAGCPHTTASPSHRTGTLPADGASRGLVALHSRPSPHRKARRLQPRTAGPTGDTRANRATTSSNTCDCRFTSFITCQPPFVIPANAGIQVHSRRLAATFRCHRDRSAQTLDSRIRGE